MKPTFCLSFRFIQPYPLFHGRADGDESEWPPSPMRAYQALLNAACLRTRGNSLPVEVTSALQVIESIRPIIIAPRATLSSTGYRAYVPHNHADLVSAAWYRGNHESSIASHRVEKDHRPRRIESNENELPTVHYLYHLEDAPIEPLQLLHTLRPSARSVHHLGWGIDQVVADASLVEHGDKAISGEHWLPSPLGSNRLRAPQSGSLNALTARHSRFLTRLVDSEWNDVPPLTAIEYVKYRRSTDPLPRPYQAFKLLNFDGSTHRHRPSQLMHLAGMVRHLAIERMNRPGFAPAGTPDDWVKVFVAGHAREDSSDHQQLSYLPLPSVGHEHTDPGIRRFMLVAPLGCDAWLNAVARQLAGQQLQPLFGNEFPDRDPPMLVPIRPDSVIRRYTQPARIWHSFTPVILPGHDDHKPLKRIKLIEKALAESGVEQSCTFEPSSFSHFRKTYSAHKYDRDHKPQGFLRPDHLLSQTAVHLTLRFDQPIPGPITLGAGRHCGFGLMVGESTA